MASSIDIEASVKRFMDACGQGRDESRETRDLRIALIDEEFTELIEAIGHGDKVLVAKELADLVYVVVGTAVAFGIPFNEVFTALQFSNMSKIGPDGKATYRADGKVLKSEHYRPAEPIIADILGEKFSG